MGDLESHPEGRRFLQSFRSSFLSQFGDYVEESAEAAMKRAMVDEMLLRNVVRMGHGATTQNEMDTLLKILNAREEQGE